MSDVMEFGRLLLGTVIYRPYVYGFFICFLFFALKHLRAKGTALFLILAYCVAYASEWNATRYGFPFGVYTYIDDTRTRELWLSNIPFWDSLSFVFLSYFSWITASIAIDPVKPKEALMKPSTAILGGLLMMLLDVIIDPLTLLGDKWFLGKIYFYPHGGEYFGVTLTNFAGWWFVGSATIFLVQAMTRAGAFDFMERGFFPRLEQMGILGVYAGVMAFNLAVTAYVEEYDLFQASMCVALITLGFVFGRFYLGRAKRVMANHGLVEEGAN